MRVKISSARTSPLPGPAFPSKHLRERQLRVFVLRFFPLARRVARARVAVERLVDGLEVEAYESRREAHGGDAPLAREAAHGRLAHLQDGGELARGQKLFAPVFLRRMGVRVLHERPPAFRA